METPSHFFKVILEDKNLRIPQEFVRKFGDELSDVATLEVPNGRVWKVGLKNEGRNIWFNDGWNEFVEYHSIYAGCFLVFKYQKNTRFRVLIFNKTGCEIHYPYNDEEEKDVENESKPHKLNNKEMYKLKESLDRRCEHNKRDEHELSALLEDMGIYIIGKSRICFAAEERERAINLAKSAKPKNPAFMVKLYQHSVHRELYVPTKFAKKYFHSGVASLKLQDSHGEKWHVKSNWTRRMGFRISKGWTQFSRDNNLDGGDICLFELIRKKDILLKLSVCKAPRF